MAAESSPHVTAVVALHSATAGMWRRLLRALVDQTSACELDVIAVVNNSGAGFAPSSDSEIEVQVFQPGLNLGYGGAIEWARREAGGDYLWILQEDLLPEPNCLAELLSEFDEASHDESGKKLGAVTPTELPSTPGPKPSILRSGGFNFVSGVEAPAGIIESGGGTVWSLEETAPVTPFLALSAALVSLPALEEAGGVDPGIWPFQFVDVDATRRLLGSGYGLRVSTRAKVTHLRNYERYSGRSNWRQTAFSSNWPYVLGKARGEISPKPSELPADIVWQVAVGTQRFLDVQSARLEPQTGLTPRQDVKRVIFRLIKVIHRRVRSFPRRRRAS